MCLWKIDRKSESCKYLEIVKINISSIRKGVVHSKFPTVSIENFYGIISYAIAVMKIEIDGNYKGAMATCEECLNEIGDEIMSRNLVRSLLGKIKKFERNPYESIENDITEEIDEIFFISIFFPMMSPKVPEIRHQGYTKDFKITRKTSNGSKRSSSSSSNTQDFIRIRGNSTQFSPSSRPKSGIKYDIAAFSSSSRPKSSYGFNIQKRISRVYLQ